MLTKKPWYRNYCNEIFDTQNATVCTERTYRLSSQAVSLHVSFHSIPYANWINPLRWSRSLFSSIEPSWNLMSEFFKTSHRSNGQVSEKVDPAIDRSPYGNMKLRYPFFVRRRRRAAKGHADECLAYDPAHLYLLFISCPLVAVVFQYDRQYYFHSESAESIQNCRLVLELARKSLELVLTSLVFLLVVVLFFRSCSNSAEYWWSSSSGREGGYSNGSKQLEDWNWRPKRVSDSCRSRSKPLSATSILMSSLAPTASVPHRDYFKKIPFGPIFSALFSLSWQRSNIDPRTKLFVRYYYVRLANKRKI